MTAPTSTETPAPGAAQPNEVETPGPGRKIAKFTPRTQELIERNRVRNEIMAQVAATNWGKGMDVVTRRAVADYCARRGLDPQQEIFILGGNIYLNAQCFLNRLQPFIQRGLILYAKPDLIHRDPELEKLAASDQPVRGEQETDASYSWTVSQWKAQREWAREESNRRWRERRLHNVPENALAASVFRIRLAVMPVEVTGCKFIVKGRTKKAKKFENGQFAGYDDVIADPVGEEFPTESVITRSARRAIKQGVAGYLPELQAWVESAEDDAETTVNAVIEAHLEQVTREAEEERKRLGAMKHVATAGYEIGTPEEETRVPAERLQLQPGAPVEDPYADKPKPEPVPVPAAREMEPLTPPGLPMREPEPLPEVTAGGGTVEDFQDDRAIAEADAKREKKGRR